MRFRVGLTMLKAGSALEPGTATNVCGLSVGGRAGNVRGGFTIRVRAGND